MEEYFEVIRQYGLQGDCLLTSEKILAKSYISAIPTSFLPSLIFPLFFLNLMEFINFLISCTYEIYFSDRLLNTPKKIYCEYQILLFDYL